LRYRLTPAADQDVSQILQETARIFGPLQRARYAALIEQAIIMIADQPERASSRPRDELAPGVRSFHVEVAARRRGTASHVLYYLRGLFEDGSDGVIVARALHDQMEPARHLERGLP